MQRRIFRAVHYLTVWCCLLALFFVINAEFVQQGAALLFSFYQVNTIALLVYINVVYLFPSLYNTDRVQWFAFYNVLMILGLTFLAYYIETNIVDDYLIYDFKKDHTPPMFLRLTRLGMFYVTSDFIAISMLLYVKVKAQLLKTKQLEEERAKSELKFLKAQINPHFLFNALNNIYALTYSKSESAPESVLKLSEMLRYVLDDCNHEKVKLSSEVDYLKNYLAFQQMKSGFNQNIELNNSAPDLEIAPMLLMPFLENSVKYSRIEEEEAAFIKVDIASENGWLHFTVKNSVSSKLPASGSGLGIENVKSRLELLYPEQHKLVLTADKHRFEVLLSLQINGR